MRRSKISETMSRYLMNLARLVHACFRALGPRTKRGQISIHGSVECYHCSAGAGGALFSRADILLAKLPGCAKAVHALFCLCMWW